ncbi:MAG: hypothetical protein AMS16_01350 [Planctomycetes bacterium DG_58]|nr:MAG: hypothetical protein AMS16_01350 [Planctomycetes bacterium DG_58]
MTRKQVRDFVSGERWGGGRGKGAPRTGRRCFFAFSRGVQVGRWRRCPRPNRTRAAIPVSALRMSAARRSSRSSARAPRLP